jgi:hypothetical protein
MADAFWNMVSLHAPSLHQRIFKPPVAEKGDLRNLNPYRSNSAVEHRSDAAVRLASIERPAVI